MTGYLSYLMLFGGCVYLLLGGDFLVRGAMALSHKMAIPPVVIGLTVVALGTSAPEMLVSVRAAIGGFPGIAIGNVVGSNIANVLLVVGAPALIHPLVSQDPSMPRQALYMTAISVLFVALCFTGSIGFYEGVLFLLIVAGGAWLTLRGKGSVPGIDSHEVEVQLEQTAGLPVKPVSIALLIVLGCIFLPVGADLAVNGAVAVAYELGVSEAAIASTMVAIGTSLPELSSTLIAAYRRSADMAFGNVIGSNILNILLIMGVTGLLTDVPVPPGFLRLDLWVMLGTALLLTFFVVRSVPVGRLTGLLFCALYTVYCVLVL